MPSAATHAPATGPPRIVAAAMNGRWKVSVACPPGSRSIRVPPASAYTIQTATPVAPAIEGSSPPIATSVRRPTSGEAITRAVARTRNPNPATMVIAV